MASFLDSRRGTSGVSKNEPKKKGIDLFIELYKRKFLSYVALNLLYILVSIPTITLYTVILMGMFYGVLNDGNAIAILMQSVAISIGLVTIFSGSPCSAGYNYVLRNYVREEHAWVASDFFEHTRKNFGRALASYLIDVAFVVISLVNISVYPTMLENMGTNFYTVMLMGLFGAIVIIYAMMHSFLWTLMVTFDLKFKQIYRNAFLLTVITLPKNIGSLLLRVFIIFLAYCLSPVIGIVLSLIMLTSMIGLIMQINAYPTIDKYLMDKKTETEGKYTEETVDERDEYGIGYVPNGPNDIAGLFKNKNKDDDNESV